MGRAGSEPVRERILRAAMKVFADLGYFRAPIHLIAREAGVSKGLIFWYFRSKDDLILEVALRSLPGDVIEECLSAGHKGKDLLHCIGERYMRKYSDPVARRLMLQTISAEDFYPQLQEAIRRICSNYIQQIAERVYGSSGVRERVGIRTFFGSLLCYTLRRPEDVSPKEYVRIIIDIVDRAGPGEPGE